MYLQKNSTDSQLIVAQLVERGTVNGFSSNP